MHGSKRFLEPINWKVGMRNQRRRDCMGYLNVDHAGRRSGTTKRTCNILRATTCSDCTNNDDVN